MLGDKGSLVATLNNGLGWRRTEIVIIGEALQLDTSRASDSNETKHAFYRCERLDDWVISARHEVRR